jgi:hypothetical protein
MNTKQKFLLGAFIILMFSMIPALKKIDPKEFLEKVAAVVVAIGYFSEGKKKDKKRKHLVSKPQKEVYHLDISFESGIYGGVIGGVLAGVFAAIAVYHNFHASVSFSLKVIPWVALMGCLFGGLIYLGRSIFATIKAITSLWANFFGCLLGCIVAGVLSGMLAMWVFGDSPYQALGYQDLVIASVLVALSLIFGILVYDYEGKIKYILFSLVVAVVLSVFISMLGFLLIYIPQIADYLDKAIYSNQTANQISAGALIGVINGFVFGLIIGFTIVVYKYWRFAEKQRTVVTTAGAGHR